MLIVTMAKLIQPRFEEKMPANLQRGISLLELMLSLAVIAMVLVLATRYFMNTRTSQQVNEAAEMITAVYAAGESWLQTQNSLEKNMIPIFINNGSIPSDFNESNINPWGGDIEAIGDDEKLTVILNQVPADACQNLAVKIQQKMHPTQVTCHQTSNNVFSADFDLSD